MRSGKMVENIFWGRKIYFALFLLFFRVGGGKENLFCNEENTTAEWKLFKENFGILNFVIYFNFYGRVFYFFGNF